MSTVYLTEQGAVVKQRAERLIVEVNGATVGEFPLLKVDRVIVFGGVHLTTSAISALLRNGIDTTFISTRGKLKGRLTPLESKNVPLRMKQYDRARTERFALDVARLIVRAKISSSMRVVSRYQRNHPECDFDQDLRQLEQTLLTTARIETLDGLRGVEGHAAAVYFQAYGRMFRGPLSFQKRTRRPPEDPVNAALSLGYTLLHNDALAVVTAVGFDPYIGFLHAVDYGRTSLALDLMEEFRAAIVDRSVLTLFNNSVLTEKDFFSPQEGGVWLSDDGRKRLLRQYEETVQRPFISKHTGHRTTFRKLMLGQAERLAQTVLHGEEYEPYVAEH